MAGYEHPQSIYSSGLKMRDETTASNKRPLPDAAATTAAAGPINFYFGPQNKRACPTGPVSSANDEYAPADGCDES